MTQSSQPISSQTKMLEPCCCSKLLMHRLMQITLLVAGILAIALGYFYLNDMPRLIVMGAGIIACALFVIGVCKNLCSQPNPPETNIQTPIHDEPTNIISPPQPTIIRLNVDAEDETRIVIAKERLRSFGAGGALIRTVESGSRSIKEHFVYSASGETIKIGWTIYFQSRTTKDQSRMFVWPVKPSDAPSDIDWLLRCARDKSEKTGLDLQTGELPPSIKELINGNDPKWMLAEDPLFDTLSIEH